MALAPLPFPKVYVDFSGIKYAPHSKCYKAFVHHTAQQIRLPSKLPMYSSIKLPQHLPGWEVLCKHKRAKHLQKCFYHQIKLLPIWSPLSTQDCYLPSKLILTVELWQLLPAFTPYSSVDHPTLWLWQLKQPPKTVIADCPDFELSKISLCKHLDNISENMVRRLRMLPLMTHIIQYPFILLHQRTLDAKH